MIEGRTWNDDGTDQNLATKTILRGRVRYVCQLDTSHSNIILGQKRHRGEELPRNEIYSGWIFHPLDNSSCLSFLSIPYSLYTLVNQSWVQQHALQIHSYHHIPIPPHASYYDPYRGDFNDNDDRRPTTQPNHESGILITISSLIEVYDGGLTVLQDGYPLDTSSSLPLSSSSLRCWTLGQLKRLQQMGEIRTTQSQFSVQGCIKAVTPLLHIPQNSRKQRSCQKENNSLFCLLQLEDREESSSRGMEHECTVVLRHSFLKQSLPPLVGQTIQLHQVMSQEWRIPQVVATYHSAETPRFVFVVERAEQIQILPSLQSNTHAEQQNMIEGTIEAVHWILAHQKDEQGKGRQQIYYLELKSSQNDKKTLLYLTFFPMDSCLQWSLRSGARIKALHLHPLDKQSTIFAACIRSSLYLMEPSHLECRTISLPYVEPLWYNRHVVLNYRAWDRRRQVKKWLRSSGLDTKIDAERLVQVLWGPHDKTEKNGKDTKHRNVYAEFFHPEIGNDEMDPEIENDFLPREDCSLLGKSLSPLHLISLSEIHDLCKYHLKLRLASYLSRTDVTVRIGWTASFVLTDLVPADSDTAIWTGGVARDESAFGYLLSTPGREGVIIPAVELMNQENNGGKGLMSQTKTSTRNGDDCTNIILARVHAVVVSLLCVTASISTRTQGTIESQDISVHVLPSFLTSNEKNGPCFSISSKSGDKFVASMFLVCGDFQNCTDSSDLSHDNQPQHEEIKCVTVRRVLEEPLVIDAGQSHFAGLLIRKFFRPKMQKQSFSGCMYTLSQIPNTSDSLSVTCLQTLDVKTSHPLNNTRVSLMRQFLSEQSGGYAHIPDDAVVLAVVWAELASSPKTCALVQGGFDELSHTSAKGHFAVHVLVPLHSRQVDAKRGYVRFHCRLLDLSAQMVSCPVERKPSHHGSSVGFDFVGGSHFWPGMVNSRPTRVGGVGELLCLSHPNPNPSIPLSALGDLSKCLSLDVGSAGRFHLSPSLVREIRHASFLGVSYCNVQAECQKCFSSLKRDQFEATPSFWNNPLPIPAEVTVLLSGSKDLSSGMLLTREPSNNHPGSRQDPFKIGWICPKGHNVSEYGAIKWECSGTLDDGTGQAKLYAERDAALILLDLCSTPRQRQYREWIEEGVWCCRDKNGIVFSRILPIDRKLGEAISKARSKRRWGEIWNEMTVLEHMDPVSRGKYLMEYHLRTSHFRPLTFFVRCKPVSPSVKQTEIRLTVPAATTPKWNDGAFASFYRKNCSYCLPPLQLNLVDAMAETGEDFVK